MEGDINRQFISPKFKELKELISSPDGVVEPNNVEDAFRAREVNEQEAITLALDLAKRYKAALAEAQGMLKRHNVVDQRMTPRGPGEKRYIEVSEDGTIKNL